LPSCPLPSFTASLHLEPAFGRNEPFPFERVHRANSEIRSLSRNMYARTRAKAASSFGRENNALFLNTAYESFWEIRPCDCLVQVRCLEKRTEIQFVAATGLISAFLPLSVAIPGFLKHPLSPNLVDLKYNRCISR
jgi:hypothetical protein